MSIHSVLTTGFGQGDADPLAGTLAHSLLCLLDKADLHFERDAESAKGAIKRAASILRIELERRSGTAQRESNPGELAAWQVNRVVQYIDNHLSTRIQLSDLSAIARRSTAHFCRAFKRTLGDTPQAFITRRRLDRAEELMLAGDQVLSEIAVVCGFSDQAHFCNRFREATGTSPAAWRRERREMARLSASLDEASRGFAGEHALMGAAN